MLEVVKNVAMFLVALPVEVLFMVLGMCCFKNLKNKRLLFYFMTLGIAVICALLIKWQLWYYIAYLSFGYIIMRWLYKSHISDLFVFSLLFSWIAITSYFTYSIVGNGIIGMVIQRILMFSVFALRGKFNSWYKCYRELWNRRDDNRIKSITLRNISLIFLNAFIVFMNFFLIFLQNSK